MKTLTFCSLVLIATELLLGGGNAQQCSPQEAIRAERESSSLQSWADVHESYKKYVQCDDGAISEGYSNSVAYLLSEKWSTVDQLNRLVEHDKGFEKFVLRHIDELMSAAQAEKIRANADDRCPLQAGHLCKLISAKLKKLPVTPEK
jgi:hypothetical protein